MITAFIAGENSLLGPPEYAFVCIFGIVALIYRNRKILLPCIVFRELNDDVSVFVPGEAFYSSSSKALYNYDNLRFSILIKKLERLKIKLPEKSNSNGWNQFLPELLVYIRLGTKKDYKRAKTLWSEMKNSNSR